MKNKKALAFARVLYFWAWMINIIIQPEQFDSLVPYIERMCGSPAIGEYFIEISIPQNLQIDTTKILQYFKKDVVLNFTRKLFNTHQVITGTLQNSEVGNYLFQKFSGSFHIPHKPAAPAVQKLLEALSAW